MDRNELPYLLPDLKGIGGVIKQRPEDFFVQEIPLYEPTGDGEHVMAEIQKVGTTTFDAIDYIARALKVQRRDIGYAGMKDAQAITRQIITIPRVTSEQVMAVTSDRITVQWAMPHRSKIRLGHLAANRFAIKVREVDPMRVVTLKSAAQTLMQRGMPNYFGEQRFGRRGDNDRLGAAFMRGDDAEVLRLMLGDPRPEHDEPAVLEARQLYERGEYQKAINTWPRFAHAECKALNKLSKSGDVHEAVMSVDSSIRRIWVSALQSRLFNAVVAKRIGGLERLMDGDLAYKHDNGACFAVENTAFEQPRANAFDISPTGPLIGRRMAMPQGEALEIEKSVLDVYGVTPDQFRSSERDRSDGDRRPLRVRPDDLRLEGGVDEHGRYITFAFTLPPGSYATVLLREFMRNDDQALPPHEEVSTEE